MKIYNMKKLLLVLVCMGMTLPAASETRAERDSLKHEVRVGWGDMIFETGMFHSTPNTNRNTSHYRYTGHIFAEYQYRVNYWCSVGGQLDYDQVNWCVGEASDTHYYVNLMVMPSVRFTYFHHPWVNLYSEIYAGVNINTGSEKDYQERSTRCAPAFGMTFLGLSVGRGHWFGTAEWGSVSALNSMNEIYKLCARNLMVSVGYRF